MYNRIYNSSLESYMTQGVLQNQNSYFFDWNDVLTDMIEIRFGPVSGSYIIPLNLDIYDYYFVGTLAYTNTSLVDFGSLEGALFYSVSNVGEHFFTSFDSFDTADYVSENVNGQSFYGKINDGSLKNACNIENIILKFNGTSTLRGDVWFSASIVPVLKDSSQDDVNNAIVQELVNINTNQMIDNQLQEQGNQLQQEGNQLQQEGNELQEEANETSKNIFEKITDFFGSFFENLINAVIGLFVPGEEEMAELFNQLNDFFADKFGFLYYPFELLTKVFNVLMSDSTSTAMTFPGITVMGYELCPAMEIDISQNELVGDLFGHIRMLTGGTMCFAFVNYLRTKFDKTVKS